MPFPYLLSSSETPSKCRSDFLILSSKSLHFFHIFHILVSEVILDNYFKSILKNVNSLFTCMWLWFKPILRFSYQLFLEVIMQIDLFPPHIFKLPSFFKNTLNKVILHSALKSPKLEFYRWMPAVHCFYYFSLMVPDFFWTVLVFRILSVNF